LDKTNPFDALNDENVNTQQQQQGKSLGEKICNNNKPMNFCFNDVNIAGGITEAKEKVLHAFGSERQNIA